MLWQQSITDNIFDLVVFSLGKVLIVSQHDFSGYLRKLNFQETKCYTLSVEEVFIYTFKFLMHELFLNVWQEYFKVKLDS